MQNRTKLYVSALLMFVLSACGGQAASVPASAPAASAPTVVAATAIPDAVAPTAAPVAESAQMTESAQAETPTEAPAEVAPASDAVARPAWQSLPLTNAQTGESFTLADFAGKTVFVEPFATWCTNCRQQLNYVNQARANFGDEVVFIALSVEPNIGNEVLAQYAADEGFGLIFAAMSPELLRELVALHGQTVTNPPATPHFVIRADGSTTDLTTGIEGLEAITSMIQAAQS